MNLFLILLIIIAVLGFSLFISIKISIKKSNKIEFLESSLASLKLNFNKINSHNLDNKKLEKQRSDLIKNIKGARTDDEAKVIINDTLNLLNEL